MNFIYIEFSDKLVFKDLPNFVRTYYEKVHEVYKLGKYNHFRQYPLWVAEISSYVKQLTTKLTSTEKLLIIDKPILDKENEINRLNITMADCSIFSVNLNNKLLVRDYINYYYKKDIGIIEGFIVILNDNIYSFDNITALIDYINRYIRRTYNIHVELQYHIFPFRASRIYDINMDIFETSQKDSNDLVYDISIINNCNFENRNIEILDENEFHNQYIESIHFNQRYLVNIKDTIFGLPSVEALQFERLRQMTVYNSDINYKIRTNPSLITESFLTKCLEHNIEYIELDVITFNDSLLLKYNKYTNLTIINRALLLLKNFQFKVILNITLGLEGDNDNNFKTLYQAIERYDYEYVNVTLIRTTDIFNFNIKK